MKSAADSRERTREWGTERCDALWLTSQHTGGKCGGLGFASESLLRCVMVWEAGPKACAAHLSVDRGVAPGDIVVMVEVPCRGSRLRACVCGRAFLRD